jgi:hypothetical protein
MRRSKRMNRVLREQWDVFLGSSQQGGRSTGRTRLRGLSRPANSGPRAANGGQPNAEPRLYSPAWRMNDVPL